MKNISHREQQRFWEEEHRNPYVLLPMNVTKPSGVAVKFWEWLKPHTGTKNLKGIEMGCGKGRNVIFFAKNGLNMVGFDFANSAIKEATRRAKNEGLNNTAKFLVHDATMRWPFANGTFDFAIDNFASTDIESLEGRQIAKNEMIRVVKPGGYIYVALLSEDDKLSKQELVENLDEANAYLYKQGGKFEKGFTEEEIGKFYGDLKLLAKEKIEKTTNFFGKTYPCLHWWLVFQK